ncbi:MAG: SET domain-containing protein-lysine N-methyltransferase [Candidatus Omnitrophica bacterium]|nr:SET domain-containing protein-lysine N-methyltransferase [Candidatus Omnitrophota bacterium]
MKPTSSPFIAVQKSAIHNQGIFAAADIPRGARIIEYIGRKITKAQSVRLADLFLEKAKGNQDHGAVYIFELNKRHDLDGAVPENTARYINHSCHPNCEAQIIRGHIWIISRRKIKAGEELTYNYGYDVDHYEDHTCHCGAPNCVGYIVARAQWQKLKKKILHKQQ